jgi:hypothetical protein
MASRVATDAANCKERAAYVALDKDFGDDGETIQLCLKTQCLASGRAAAMETSAIATAPRIAP